MHFPPIGHYHIDITGNANSFIKILTSRGNWKWLYCDLSWDKRWTIASSNISSYTPPLTTRQLQYPVCITKSPLSHFQYSFPFYIIQFSILIFQFSLSIIFFSLSNFKYYFSNKHVALFIFHYSYSIIHFQLSIIPYLV